MQAAISIHTLAVEAADAFETRTRSDVDQSRYVTLKDGAPEWLGDIVRDAHGSMLPDDWRYQTIRDAFHYIAEAGPDEDPEDIAHEFADAVDVYTGQLAAWLTSHQDRAGYCDDAAAEFMEGGAATEPPTIARMMMLGQYQERREVFEAVAQGLREHAEDV